MTSLPVPSPYIRWAKESPPARHDLAVSNFLALPLDELPGARDAWEAFGTSAPWPSPEEGLAERYGVDADRIATSAGASGGCFLVLAALVAPGDTVLTEWPGYDAHPAAARLLGAGVQTFSRGAERDFAPDWAALNAALEPGVRAVLLTDLHNPSGVTLERGSLLELAERAEAVGAKIVVDEVYRETVTGIDPTPAGLLHPALVSVNSLSKSYGLSGVRLGWTLSDAETARRIRLARDVVDGVEGELVRRLGAAAVERLDALAERARRILEPSFRLLERFVDGRPELDWVPPPKGAPVAFPRLRGVEDTYAFVEAAHSSHGVKVAPGRLFGAADRFRVSIAALRAPALTEALDALGRALDRL